ncbi:MAG: hypothetical protein ACD_79C00874G0001 [uncultured bacterium]|nr:MAG: hypothetical protein ACD_79C00874G0001 [uncultured bacterium]
MYLEAIEVWGKILSEDSVHARAKEGMLESHLRIKTREEQKKLKEEKEKEDKIKSKINSLNEQAERLFTSEMYSEAIEVWGKILFEDSANTRAKEGILESHLRIKTREEQKKIREEKEIEEKIRSKINSLNEQAERFFQSEMFKEAIEVWRKVLVEDSADSKAKEGILEASSRIKILEEQKIIKGQKEIEDRIRSRVDSLNEQAERFFQNGMYKEAIDVWGKVLNEEMTNPKAKEGILECHLRLQNIEKERLLKEENIRSEKEKCEQLSFKAQVLYNEDNFLEAIKLWEEVLVSSPLHNDARRGIMQAKTRYRELELCRDVKFRLEKSFSEIEKRFNEFKKQFSEGNKYFLAGDYRRALDIWNSIENT